MTLSRAVVRELAGIVGEGHVLTGEATAGFVTDWTGRFRGGTSGVVRPRDTAEVAAVLALCTDAGLAVVPQGGEHRAGGRGRAAAWRGRAEPDAAGLPLARSEGERALFGRIRSAFDPAGTLNPNVLPRR